MYAQSCLTLCNSMDYSPPGSSVHGIFQTRILGWVDISYSRDLPDPGIRLLKLSKWYSKTVDGLNWSEFFKKSAMTSGYIPGEIYTFQDKLLDAVIYYHHIVEVLLGLGFSEKMRKGESIYNKGTEAHWVKRPGKVHSGSKGSKEKISFHA